MTPTKAELITALQNVNPAIVATPYGRGLSIEVPRTFQRRLEEVCTGRGLRITRTNDPGRGDVVTVEVFGFPRRSGVIKKRATAPAEFVRLLNVASKAALLDALWCSCQLGTDESAEQITTKAARELKIALDMRGDRVPSELAAAAERRIDSDPSEN